MPADVWYGFGNELIAEVLLQEDIGTVSDFFLLEMVKRCTE